MEVSGDALAVLDYRQPAQSTLETGGVDRSSGDDGEPLDGFLVFGREAALFVGEVEVAEDLGAEPYRDPEKRVHVGMVLREAGEIRMARDVIEPHRLAVPGDRAEEAPACGRRTDGLGDVAVEPDVDELLEASLIVEHAERSVWSARKVHRGLHGGVEDRCQIGLAGYRGRALEQLRDPISVPWVSRHGRKANRGTDRPLPSGRTSAD